MEIVELTTGMGFDLPENATLSYTLTSPFFQQGGSFSLPLQLPLSDRNRQLLGFADRLDSGESKQTVSVVVREGILTEHGTLSLLSTTLPSDDASGAFECTVLLREENIYSLLQDVTLPEILRPYTFGVTVYPRRKSGSSGSSLTTLQSRMLSPQTDDNGEIVLRDDWEIFPVQSEKLILNNVYIYHQQAVPSRGTPEKYIPQLKYQSSRTGQTITIDDQKLEDGPTGLGVTVFLHLTYVVEKLFAHIGKTVAWEFPKDKDGNELYREEFSRMVILNNTIDAAVPESIYYDTLVPNITAIEFLQALFAMFSIGVFEKEPNQVTLCFMYSALTGDPVSIDTVFADYLNTMREQEITYEEKKALSIQPQHIRLEGDNEILSLEDLQLNYYVPDTGIRVISTEQTNPTRIEGATVPTSLGEVTESEVLYDHYTGLLLYASYYDNDGNLSDTAKMHIICRDQLNFDGRDVSEDRLLNSDVASGRRSSDTSLHTEDAPLADTRVGDIIRYDPTIQARIPSSNPYLYLPVIQGLQNRTCDIQLVTTSDDGSVTTEDMTQNDEMPLALAYLGKTTFTCNHPLVGNFECCYGSPCSSLDASAEEAKTDLTARGFMTTMHTPYARMLLRGMHSVTAVCYMTVYELQKFDFSRTLLHEGKRYLPTALQVQLDNNLLQRVTLNLLSLPYDD